MKIYMIRPFTDGRKSAEIEYVGEAPRTVVMDLNIDTVSVMIKEDLHSPTGKLADDLHIPRKSIQRILTKGLGMKYVCSVWVPHFLWGNRALSFSVWKIWHEPATIKTFSPVITIDESWINHYDPKMKPKSEA